MMDLIQMAGWCGCFALACAVGEVVWAALAADPDPDPPPDPWELWQDTGDPVGRAR